MLALLALTWSFAEPALAHRDGVELRWQAPADECPRADVVLDDALGMLAAAPSAEIAVTAVAEIVAAPDGFTLTLEVRTGDGGGTRTVHARECAQLGRIAALVIAVAIDPSAATRLGEPPPIEEPLPDVAIPPPIAEPLPVPEPEPEPMPVPVPDRVAPPKKLRPPIPLHGSIVLGLGLGAFALPTPTAAFELGLALSGRAWRVELGGAYWAPSELSPATETGIGGRFQLAVGVGRGCWVPRFGTIELPVCAVALAGGMIGRGTGEDLVRASATAPWAAFGGGPTLLWRPRRPGGRIALMLRVEGLGAATRTRFRTQPSGEPVWRSSVGALQAFAGVEVRFASRP
ncbi:MAG: hypothetical protein IAG13_36300 [Deltaproteobacteria bacterium]|nr:hypothetical protein [Nannocystaceae bacterium]